METPFEITGNKITLKNYKDNKAAYTISFGFMYFCAAMPFIILTILLSSGFKVGGGFIFSFVLFGSIAYFFYRIATWNKFGIDLSIILKQKAFPFKKENSTKQI
jgi:hypothetical protein